MKIFFVDNKYTHSNVYIFAKDIRRNHIRKEEARQMVEDGKKVILSNTSFYSDYKKNRVNIRLLSDLTALIRPTILHLDYADFKNIDLFAVSLGNTEIMINLPTVANTVELYRELRDIQDNSSIGIVCLSDGCGVDKLETAELIKKIPWFDKEVAIMEFDNDVISEMKRYSVNYQVSYIITGVPSILSTKGHCLHPLFGSYIKVKEYDKTNFLDNKSTSFDVLTLYNNTLIRMWAEGSNGITFDNFVGGI